jgi:hypothetical protein
VSEPCADEVFPRAMSRAASSGRAGRCLRASIGLLAVAALALSAASCGSVSGGGVSNGAATRPECGKPFVVVGTVAMDGNVWAGEVSIKPTDRKGVIRVETTPNVSISTILIDDETLGASLRTGEPIAARVRSCSAADGAQKLVATQISAVFH